MADPCDLAQEQMEREEAMRERARRNSMIPTAVYHTHCNWCGDPTEEGARFCCFDCAKDWENYEAAKVRNGG